MNAHGVLVKGWETSPAGVMNLGQFCIGGKVWPGFGDTGRQEDLALKSEEVATEDF